jgi:hypothetical protein
VGSLFCFDSKERLYLSGLIFKYQEREGAEKEKSSITLFCRDICFSTSSREEH